MKRTALLAALCASAGMALAVAPAAQATCLSSTPSAATFADDPFDGDELAPEITTISVGLDAACTVSMDPRIDALVGDDAVFTYIDRDGSPATGSQLFGGADVVVGTLGEIGEDYPPILGTWNGVEFTFSDPAPVGSVPSLGGFAAHVDRLGLTPGTTIGVQVATVWRGTYGNYVDMAPEPGAGSIPLAVNFSTAAPPPPPPPPAPTPVPTPVATPVPSFAVPEAEAQPAGCTVPRVKGRTRAAAESRLFDADCEVAFSVVKRYSSTVRKGRVIGSTPGAGATTTKRVKLIVSKGRKRARARKSAATPSVLERLETLANAPLR